MHSNTVLNQLLNLLPRHHFEQLVSEAGSDRYVKHFTTWNQLTVLLYAQASGKQTLRDIQVAMDLQQSKLYHLGVQAVKRSTLADANAKRDYRIMERLFGRLLERCQQLAPKHRFRFKNPAYAFDSTVIELSLKLFPWATFVRAKGGIKLHCHLDLRGHIPSFVVVSPAQWHDRHAAKDLVPLIPDSIYIMDRGYMDFGWLRQVHDGKAFFVVRAWDNLAYHVTGQQPVDEKKNLLLDQTIVLSIKDTLKKYPLPLRLVAFRDPDTGTVYRYLTNNWTLSAWTISQLYKDRRQVELFFKWIKQHLKIKTFLGTSQNAVMTQIWIAMCYYLLLSYIKFQSRCRHSLFLLHRLIQNTLLDRFHLIDLLHLNEKRLAQLRTVEPQLYLRF